MKEKYIEQQLVKHIKALGGMCSKMGMDGMPDRLVLLPKGEIHFVELKAPGKKPRALQELRHQQLRKLGFTVHVIDSTKQIQEVFPDEV